MFGHPGFVWLSIIIVCFLLLFIVYRIIVYLKYRDREKLRVVVIISIIGLFYSALFPLLYLRDHMLSLQNFVVPEFDYLLLEILNQNHKEMILFFIPLTVFFILSVVLFILFGTTPQKKH